MIQTKEMDVKRDFDLTPQADLFPAFMDQIFKAEIETVAFEKGSMRLVNMADSGLV